MSKEEIIKFATDWIKKQWLRLTDSTVSLFEFALSIIIGFNSTYNNYQGQNEDLNKLVENVSKYPCLNIEAYCRVINENKPWNFEKVWEKEP